MTRYDFTDPADLRTCRSQADPRLDGPGRPNSEKHAVDATFAKTRDIDMSISVALRQIETRIQQPLRGVTVRVYHQRPLVEPSRLPDVLLTVCLHGGGL